MGLPITLAVLTFLIFFLGMWFENHFGARTYPEKPYWRVRGFLFMCLGAAMTTPVPFIFKSLFGEGWMAFPKINPWSAGIFGYFVSSFFSYSWHRATHTSKFLWRWTHQMHHAPLRVDLAGVGVMHPFESFAYAVIKTTVLVGVLGLPIDALAVCAFISQMYNFFGHLNIKTPRFIGYIIQRPEAHVLHHRRKRADCNFGDFPLWDILFGTYENPISFGTEDTGFGRGKDEAYGEMLMGKLVS